MSPRIVFFLPAVLAAVATTASVGAAQAEVEVTLQLARTTLHECEPLWIAFRFANRSDRQLAINMKRPGFVFERHEGELWRPVDLRVRVGSDWQIATHMVAPEVAVHGEIRLGYSMTQLEPGEYRVRVVFPRYVVPGDSAWHVLTVLPHAGNREFTNRLEAAPRAEPAGTAASRYFWGGVRAGFPFGLTLLEYERHMRAFASGAALSPGLAAELQHEFATIARNQALRARHAGDEATAREHAKAGLALLAAIDLSTAQRMDTGGQPAAIRESRIDLLSISSPEVAAIERQTLMSEFPLRRGAVRLPSR
jgi:hypothetical protein